MPDTILTAVSSQRTFPILLWFTAIAILGCRAGSREAANPQRATKTESQRLNQFFEDVFEQQLNDSPEMLTYLGMKRRYGEWDDDSEKTRRARMERLKGHLAHMKSSFDFALLDPSARVSYRIFELEVNDAVNSWPWRHHDYAITQMHSPASDITVFLSNAHRIDDAADAEAYISRIQKTPALLDQIKTDLRTSADHGIIPPSFVFPKVLNDFRTQLRGRPFDQTGVDCAILADFRAKVDSLELGKRESERLLVSAEDALRDSLGPAFRAFAEVVASISKRANNNHGVWHLPRGREFYVHKLDQITQTTLTPEQIYEIGRKDVKRIHGEMRQIMSRVGFKGSLAEFFRFMRTSRQFYKPNTVEGRSAYLALAQQFITGIENRISELFVTLPRSGLEVRAVESFRQKNTGAAFYEGPAPDGSRPGYFYVNLADMNAMPVYQLEALVYHEAIPGHHLQISIATEAESLPRFRRFGGAIVFTEGWGLYAELLPKELGFYQDPYSDFGRLSMELWRAARLIVDTGLHVKQWSRQRAVDYLQKNTAEPLREIEREVDRYLVWPGQATAYKLGMRGILRLREKARKQLGQRFDLRQFHDVVLTNGPVPLSILEWLVDDWLRLSSSQS